MYNSIAGKWKLRGYGNYFEFTGDGSKGRVVTNNLPGAGDGIFPGEYIYAGSGKNGVLTLMFSDMGMVVFNVDINGDALTLSDPASGFRETFYKV